MRLIFKLITCIAAFSAISGSSTAQDQLKEKASAKQFAKMNDAEWKCRFKSKADWTKQWFLDGELAKVSSNKDGIVFHAGPTPASDADHSVLWTKKSFEGDIKIEYNFVRLDSLDRFVDIIYIQAQGSGAEGFDEDIALWNDKRNVPAMKHYFNNMNTLHISYAAYENSATEVNPHYIRGRRYMPEWGKGLEGTDLMPEYLNPMIFKPGVKYHFTFIKRGKELIFKVDDPEGNEEFFYFSAEKFPAIEEGRIGLRQMSARKAMYDNIRIYTEKQ